MFFNLAVLRAWFYAHVISTTFALPAGVGRVLFLRQRRRARRSHDRASASIVLNIAGGAGEFAKREKARFYRIARRSATEFAEILDILRELELVEQAKLELRRRPDRGLSASRPGGNFSETLAILSRPAASRRSKDSGRKRSPSDRKARQACDKWHSWLWRC